MDNSSANKIKFRSDSTFFTAFQDIISGVNILQDLVGPEHKKDVELIKKYISHSMKSVRNSQIPDSVGKYYLLLQSQYNLDRLPTIETNDVVPEDMIGLVSNLNPVYVPPKGIRNFEGNFGNYDTPLSKYNNDISLIDKNSILIALQSMSSLVGYCINNNISSNIYPDDIINVLANNKYFETAAQIYNEIRSGNHNIYLKYDLSKFKSNNNISLLRRYIVANFTLIEEFSKFKDFKYNLDALEKNASTMKKISQIASNYDLILDESISLEKFNDISITNNIAKYKTILSTLEEINEYKESIYYMSNIYAFVNILEMKNIHNVIDHNILKSSARAVVNEYSNIDWNSLYYNKRISYSKFPANLSEIINDLIQIINSESISTIPDDFKIASNDISSISGALNFVSKLDDLQSMLQDIGAKSPVTKILKSYIEKSHYINEVFYDFKAELSKITILESISNRELIDVDDLYFITDKLLQDLHLGIDALRTERIKNNHKDLKGLLDTEIDLNSLTASVNLEGSIKLFNYKATLKEIIKALDILKSIIFDISQINDEFGKNIYWEGINSPEFKLLESIELLNSKSGVQNQHDNFLKLHKLYLELNTIKLDSEIIEKDFEFNSTEISNIQIELKKVVQFLIDSVKTVASMDYSIEMTFETISIQMINNIMNNAKASKNSTVFEKCKQLLEVYNIYQDSLNLQPIKYTEKDLQNLRLSTNNINVAISEAFKFNTLEINDLTKQGDMYNEVYIPLFSMVDVIKKNIKLEYNSTLLHYNFRIIEELDQTPLQEIDSMFKRLYILYSGLYTSLDQSNIQLDRMPEVIQTMIANEDLILASKFSKYIYTINDKYDVHSALHLKKKVSSIIPQIENQRRISEILFSYSDEIMLDLNLIKDYARYFRTSNPDETCVRTNDMSEYARYAIKLQLNQISNSLNAMWGNPTIDFRYEDFAINMKRELEEFQKNLGISLNSGIKSSRNEMNEYYNDETTHTLSNVDDKSNSLSNINKTIPVNKEVSSKLLKDENKFKFPGSGYLDPMLPGGSPYVFGIQKGQRKYNVKQMVDPNRDLTLDVSVYSLYSKNFVNKFAIKGNSNYPYFVPRYENDNKYKKVLLLHDVEKVTAQDYGVTSIKNSGKGYFDSARNFIISNSSEQIYSKINRCEMISYHNLELTNPKFAGVGILTEGLGLYKHYHKGKFYYPIINRLNQFMGFGRIINYELNKDAPIQIAFLMHDGEEITSYIQIIKDVGRFIRSYDGFESELLDTKPYRATLDYIDEGLLYAFNGYHYRLKTDASKIPPLTCKKKHFIRISDSFINQKSGVSWRTPIDFSYIANTFKPGVDEFIEFGNKINNQSEWTGSRSFLIRGKSPTGNTSVPHHQYEYSPDLISPLFNFGPSYANALVKISLKWTPVNTWDNEIFYCGSGNEVLYKSNQINGSSTLNINNQIDASRIAEFNARCDKDGRVQIFIGTSLNQNYGGSFDEYYTIQYFEVFSLVGIKLYSSSTDTKLLSSWSAHCKSVTKDPIHKEMLGPIGLNSENPYQVSNTNMYDSKYGQIFKQDFGPVPKQNIVNKGIYETNRYLDFGIENANKECLVELFYVLHDLAIPSLTSDYIDYQLFVRSDGTFGVHNASYITLSHSSSRNSNIWGGSGNAVFGPIGKYEQNFRTDTDYAIESLGELEVRGVLSWAGQNINRFKLRPVTVEIGFRIKLDTSVPSGFRPKFIIYSHNLHECTFDPERDYIEESSGDAHYSYRNHPAGTPHNDHIITFTTYINDEGKLPLGFGFKSSLGVSKENFDIFKIRVYTQGINNPLLIKCQNSIYDAGTNSQDFTAISINDVVKSSRYSSDLLMRFMKVVQLDSAGKLSTELAFNSIFGIERASFSINRFDATVLQNGYYVDGVQGTSFPSGWSGNNTLLKLNASELSTNNIYSGFEIKGIYSNVNYTMTPINATGSEIINSSIVICNGTQFVKKTYSIINKNNAYVDGLVSVFIHNIDQYEASSDEELMSKIIVYVNNIIVPYKILQSLNVSSTPVRSKMLRIQFEARVIGNSLTLGFGFIKTNNSQSGFGFSEIMFLFNEICDLENDPDYWRSVDSFELEYPNAQTPPPELENSTRGSITYGPEFSDVQILPPKHQFNNSEPVLTGINYIFNKFHRFNGQDYFIDRAHAVASSSHPDAYTWVLDDTTFKQTSNSSYLNGLVSIYEYDKYKMDVVIGSDNADDDHIGICIAFKRIGTVNYVLCVGTSAGGLGSTGPYRNGTGVYVIEYASGYGPTRWSLLGHTNIGNRSSGGWSSAGLMKYWVERNGTLLDVWCSNYSSSDSNFRNNRAHKFATINLMNDPLTVPLASKAAYGFVNISQSNAAYYEINIDVESNGISQIPIITNPGIKKLTNPFVSNGNDIMLNDAEFADKGIPKLITHSNGYDKFFLEKIALDMLDVRTPDFAFDSAYGVYLEGRPTQYTVPRSSLIHQDNSLNFANRTVHYSSGLPYREAGKYGKGLSPKDLTNTLLVEAVNNVPTVNKLIGDGREEFNTTYRLRSFANRKIKMNVILTCYGSWTSTDEIIIFINGEVSRTIKGNSTGLQHTLEKDGNVVEKVAVIESNFDSGGSVRIGFGMKSNNTILSTAFTIGTISIISESDQVVNTPTSEIARQLKYDCVMEGDEVLITLSNGNKIRAKKVRSIFYPSAVNMFFALRSEYGDMWHLITPTMLHDSDPIKQEMLSRYNAIELERFYYKQNEVAFKYASTTYDKIGLYPVVGTFIGEPRLFRVDDTEIIYQSPEVFKAFNKVINNNGQVVGYMDANGYDIIFNGTFTESIRLNANDCVEPENMYRIHYVNKED